MASTQVVPGGTREVFGARPEPGLDGFQRTVQELQEEFAYLIHEIRSPLTAVISAGELLKGLDLPAAEKAALLDSILEESRRINGLLKDYFQVCHEDAGVWLSRMSFSTIPVAELLQGAMLRFRNASPKHRLQASLAADLPPVRGDRTKLDLVMRNLVANALKYSPAGGSVILAARPSGDQVVISVRDEGLGIPEENLRSIFEKSFRVDRPEIRDKGGAGLGLTMVRRIVESHGGSIRVESAPGQGSAFFFSLPQAVAENFA